MSDIKRHQSSPILSRAVEFGIGGHSRSNVFKGSGLAEFRPGAPVR